MKTKLAHLAQAGRIVVGAALLFSAGPAVTLAQAGDEAQAHPVEGGDHTDLLVRRLLQLASNSDDRWALQSKAMERLGFLMRSSPKIRGDVLDQVRYKRKYADGAYGAAIMGLKALPEDQREEFLGELMDAVVAADGSDAMIPVDIASKYGTDQAFVDQLKEALASKKEDLARKESAEESAESAGQAWDGRRRI